MNPDISGAAIVIRVGKLSGQKGVCLGPVPQAKDLWAVSPDTSELILNLQLGHGFTLIRDPNTDPSPSNSATLKPTD